MSNNTYEDYDVENEVEEDYLDDDVVIPRPVTEITLYTNSDGSISGTWYTNDDTDSGYVGVEASMEVHYCNRDSMDKCAGKTRQGMCCDVTVTLDGEIV